MNKYTTLIWLLPIIFMLHDFEEIIFFNFFSINLLYLHILRDNDNTHFPNFGNRFMDGCRVWVNGSEFGFCSQISGNV